MIFVLLKLKLILKRFEILHKNWIGIFGKNYIKTKIKNVKITEISLYLTMN